MTYSTIMDWMLLSDEQQPIVLDRVRRDQPLGDVAAVVVVSGSVAVT
jgi:hypothetical protein